MRHLGHLGTSSTRRTETYAYDDLSRLVAVDYGDGETQGDPANPVSNPGYSFDPMGNRLSKKDTVGGTSTTTSSGNDAANRLTARGDGGR